MGLERQNILEIIRRNSNKYSSCLITCFTFDFSFFEERMMPALRRANVKNINVLVDGKQLDQSLENLAGDEFGNNKIYSLIPIHISGAFHPKIMYLAGEKNGLLIIGSGNLTSSGLNTNDEVWAVFHINIIESINAPIFAYAWSYLKQYFSHLKGYHKQKIEWFYEYYPWMNELHGKLNSLPIKIEGEQEVWFLANNSSGSIYQQLVDILPSTKIKKLSIVSPYFDSNGKLIDQFNEDFEIDQISCITDKDFGLPPLELSESLKTKTKFFDWADCVENVDKRFNRLHAKIFQFEYKDKWEYLLIGSANATFNAFGSKNSSAKNGEAIILLKRKLTRGYLKDLGVNTDEISSIDLSSFVRNEINQIELQDHISKEFRIINSEKSGSILSVFYVGKEKPFRLQILNKDLQITESFEVISLSDKIEINLLNPHTAYLLYFCDGETRISNRSLIHDQSNQSKTNPDPHQGDLSNFIEEMLRNPDGEAYVQLLNYVDYSSLDYSSFSNNNIIVNSSISLDLKRENKERIKYTELTEELLYSLPSRAYKSESLHNPSIQIAELLNKISKGWLNTNSELLDSEEEVLATLEVDDQDGQGGDIPPTLVRKVYGRKLRNAIEKHFKKVDEFYYKKLDRFFKNRQLQESHSGSVSLKDLSNTAIMVELLYLFYGESFVVEYIEFRIHYKKHLRNKIREIEKKCSLDLSDKTDKDNLNIKYYWVEQGNFIKAQNLFLELDSSIFINQDEYLSYNNIEFLIEEGKFTYDDRYGLKLYLLTTIGVFLLCMNENATFHSYEYRGHNDKMDFFRKEIFGKLTFLLLNVEWKDNEKVLKDLLLLDLLNFILRDDLKTQLEEITENAIQDLYDMSKFKSPYFEENLEYYKKILLPDYRKWKILYSSDERNNLIVDKNELKSGNIIYNSRIGFSKIKQIGIDFLLLEKPGFEYNDLMGEGMLLKLEFLQNKVVLFK